VCSPSHMRCFPHVVILQPLLWFLQPQVVFPQPLWRTNWSEPTESCRDAGGSNMVGICTPAGPLRSSPTSPQPTRRYSRAAASVIHRFRRPHLSLKVTVVTTSREGSRPPWRGHSTIVQKGSLRFFSRVLFNRTSWARSRMAPTQATCRMFQPNL
jgi:hypothetical protein